VGENWWILGFLLQDICKICDTYVLPMGFFYQRKRASEVVTNLGSPVIVGGERGT